MNARASTCLALLGAAFLSLGCDDSLKRVSLIEETRVLGARTEVEGDPLRSSPKPGERATTRFFVAAPGGAPSVSFALSMCKVKPVFSGFPDCVGAPFAEAQRESPSDAPVELMFDVPPALDLEATPNALVQGSICAADTACTELGLELDLGSATTSNYSPTFAADALTLDGEPWPSIDEPTCGNLPEVSARSSHRLSVTLAEEDFEAIAQPTSVDPSRETLLVSLFSDLGELNHAFISLEVDTPASASEVSWSAPAEAGVARFYFVVRDERGGQDFQTRALCVVP